MGCWGLLGVAGMMTLIVRQWIIPENSLRLYRASKFFIQNHDHIGKLVI